MNRPSDVRTKVVAAIHDDLLSGGSSVFARRYEIAEAAIKAHLQGLGEGGYAVIALPAPDSPNSGSFGGEPTGTPIWQRDGKHGGYASIIARPGEVMAAINCLSTPDDMRWAAAALLAAAAEAEK